MAALPPRVFLLSPARAGGERMGLLLNPRAGFALAWEFQQKGAALGECFEFASGLYFRGKLAYARAFARPPRGLPGALVIAPGAGLVPADTSITAEQLQKLGSIPVDEADPRFRQPLDETSRLLDSMLGPGAEIVLLGSIASQKYVAPLLAVFGRRLLFPGDFVGRGDMS